MAGGRRYKFQGSTIAVLTAYQGESPSVAISAATKANPCVLTVGSGHGRVAGDVIEITGVVGMVELNNTSFIVSAVDSTHITLYNTDSSGYTTYASGGAVQGALFSNFCELTSYDRTGGSSPQIDATSLCSTANEYEVGLPDSGTTKIGYNFAPQTAIQLAIAAFDTSKELMAVRIELPNSGGKRVQLGFIQQTSESVSKGGLWTGNITIQNTGPYFDFT